MDAGDWIAVYASIVATGAFGWNAFVWVADRRMAEAERQRREQTRLDVVFNSVGPADDLESSRIFGSIVNRSEHEVEVTDVTLHRNWNEEREHGDMYWYAGVSEGVHVSPSTPFRLGPKQGIDARLDVTRAIVEEHFAWPFVVQTRTADGTFARSEEGKWAKWWQPPEAS